MSDLTVDELERLAEAMGLSLSGEQLRGLLPEVQRLREHATRLRGIPLEPEEPAVRFANHDDR